MIWPIGSIHHIFNIKDITKKNARITGSIGYWTDIVGLSLIIVEGRRKHNKQDEPFSFGAFLIRVRGMYLLAKPKNKDHLSCLADSHLA